MNNALESRAQCAGTINQSRSKLHGGIASRAISSLKCIDARPAHRSLTSVFCFSFIPFMLVFFLGFAHANTYSVWTIDGSHPQQYFNVDDLCQAALVRALQNPNFSIRSIWATKTLVEQVGIATRELLILLDFGRGLRT